MSDIELYAGGTMAMEQVKQYFSHLFQVEQSGDPFPVDLEAVWAFAYTTKSNAKKALVGSTEFFEGEDYHIFQSDDMVKRPQGGGRQHEKIVLSVQCFEYFIARRVRPIFEIYRQCRIAVTEAAKPKPFAHYPPHLRRYMLNHDKIPHGSFSILQELMVRLLSPLEAQGYVLPERLLPDISVGRIFCKWLRETKGINTDEFETYDHAFEDGRIVQAKLYPMELLSDFGVHFQSEWLKNRAEKYFEQRDKTALPCLPKMLEVRPSSRRRASLN